MNKRPGHVVVTTEVGFCSFCGRPRNLRREEHQLGALVRTIVTCETCHRTISSSMGVAGPEPEPAPVALEPETAPEPVVADVAAGPAKTRPAPKPKPAAKAAPKRTAAAGSTASKKSAPKKRS